MPVIKKHATVVSVDTNLKEVAVGEQIQFFHDPNNEYDKFAINAYRATTKEQIGYMAASPHTTLEGCENNRQLFPYIPSPQVPLVGTVVKQEAVSFRNGEIRTVLKIEIYVVSKDKAV